MVTWTRPLERRCAAGATGSPLSTSDGPPGPDDVRRGCGARSSPSSPDCRSTMWCGWSRGVPRALRRRSSRAWPGHCSCNPWSATTPTGWPASSRHRRGRSPRISPPGSNGCWLASGTSRSACSVPTGPCCPGPPHGQRCWATPARGRGSSGTSYGSVFTTGPNGLSAWPVLHDGDALKRALVADLRAAHIDHPDDRGLVDLVADLRARSTEFTRLWDEGVIGRHVSARKTVVHPQVGELTLRLRRAHRPRLRRPARRLHGGLGFRRRGKVGVPAGHERGNLLAAESPSSGWWR